MDFYSKYIKYKTKYIQLKYNHFIGGSKDDFFFIHDTFNFDNLISILKDNQIKLSSLVDKDRRFRSKDDNMNYIYGTIYFKSLNNLSHIPNFTLILSHKLLDDYKIIINKGWTGSQLITINLDDSPKKKYKKLKFLKSWLKNPKGFPSTLIDPSGLMMHEVLFEKNIPIDKYLIGITCNQCSQEQLNEIKKYTKVNINTTNLISNT